MRQAVLVALLLALSAPAPAAAAPIPFAPIGDEFRLSQTGGDDDPNRTAASPAVAYGASRDRYLSVWEANPAGNEVEIFGRVLDGSGRAVSPTRRISHQGPDEDANFRVTTAAVAYNETAREFLVAWSGTTAAGDGEDIHVRRVSSAGVPLGTDAARISDTGPSNSSNNNAEEPSIAWNATGNEYLVAWHADDSANNHREIYVQRLRGSDAAPVGGDDVQVSDTGPDDTSSTSVADPSVVHNAAAGEYLVAFRSDADETTLTGEAIRIQRLAADGSELGDDDRRISDVGAGDGFNAGNPSLAFDPAAGRYLVAWHGGPNSDDLEIQTRLLSAAGATATDQRQTSVAGTTSADGLEAQRAVVARAAPGEFLVVWSGEETGFAHSHVRGQRVATTSGADVGADDFAIGATGAPADPDAGGFVPDLAANPARHELLGVWDGTPGAVAGLHRSKSEVFGRSLADGSGRTSEPGRPATPAAPPSGTGPAAIDLTPPVLGLRRGRPQRILRTRGVKVVVSADEAALFGATGTIKLPGRAARTVRLKRARSRGAGRRATLRLAAPKRARRTLRNALRRRRSLKARVTVTATNAVGLKSSRKVTLKLVR